MPKIKELCEDNKAVILALLEISMSEKQVVKKVKISKTAVHYTKKKQVQRGSTKLLAGHCRKLALWRNVICSARTVGNRLLEAGLKSHRAGKKPFIKKRQRKTLLLFAGNHKDWTVDDWAKVLFRVEFSFQLMPTYWLGGMEHGGGSVTIWGCFSLGGTWPVKQVMYRTALEHSLLPSAGKLFSASNDWIFQQDKLKTLQQEWASMPRQCRLTSRSRIYNKCSAVLRSGYCDGNSIFTVIYHLVTLCVLQMGPLLS
uniref:Transposase Tc1-like domain-containing protein n=1 Tax=Acanthochromis polyacanthus TaxID=80966 RepID=A0A3Q1GCR0_9TELE